MQETILPIYTTSLVGRIRETQELAALILEDSTRLVSLIGTSGTGKTRLSLEVCTLLTAQEHRVVFVPLTAIKNPALVLPTLAHQLGLRESGSVPLIEQIIAYIESTPLVIVLDNFEQVLPAAAEIEQLLNNTTTAKMLVTSQLALSIKHETVYTIPGLDVPTTTPDTPQQAMKSAAIQLFVNRIQGVQPRFVLNTSNFKSVVEICQMLEGLPLAIEIVAAHSDVLLPPDLKLLVHQHLMLYRFRARKATGRQRIILPIIEWSLSRLPEQAQMLFNCLGAFQGGWMFDALEYVAGDMQLNLQATLAMLAERHLILQQATQNEQIRYMMLDAVQDFAQTRFAQLDSAQQLAFMQNSIAFFIPLAEKSLAALIRGYDQAYWMERITQEIPNLRFLLAWAINAGSLLGADLAIPLGRFWMVGGYWKEGLDWYNQIEQTMDLSELQVAQVAANKSSLLAYLSRYDEALTVIQNGIVAAQIAGSLYTEARLTMTHGVVLLMRLDYDRAKDVLLQALLIAKQVDDAFLISATLVNIAALEGDIQDFEQSLLHLQEAVVYAHKNQQTLFEMFAVSNIGNLYNQLGKPDLAIDALDSVIEYAQTTKMYDLYGSCLCYKAQSLLLKHSLPQAAALVAESIEVLVNIDSYQRLVIAADCAVVCLVHVGRFEAAGKLFGAVDRLRLDINKERIPEQSVVIKNMLEQIHDSAEFTVGRDEGVVWTTSMLVDFALNELGVVASDV